MSLSTDQDEIGRAEQDVTVDRVALRFFIVDLTRRGQLPHTLSLRPSRTEAIRPAE